MDCLALEVSGKELHYLLTDVGTTGCPSGKKNVLKPHATLRSSSQFKCEKQVFKKMWENALRTLETF